MQHLWKSVDEVLDYALGEEQKAVITYKAFARQAGTAELRRVFEGFVDEETAHFKKLLRMKKSGNVSLPGDGLNSLPRPKGGKLPADQIVDAEGAYRFAIRAEKAAWELYWVFSEMADDLKIRHVFKLLAEEEKAHRAKLQEEWKQRQSPKGFLKGLVRLLWK
ncbi:MAG TPA: ferritin family protein [Planctomycetota bacterium]|nr:ferritin family protein [Planctomycetota bacterium]HRR81294.1 ferritin family protein [Planctomycetota bacterium]HRT96000.1 ferritin family protein [Planctomycetota bacterium]